LVAPNLGHAHTPFGEPAEGRLWVSVRRKRQRFGILGAQDSRLGEGASQIGVRARQCDVGYDFEFYPI
jgi:hypothetical protein